MLKYQLRIADLSAPLILAKRTPKGILKGLAPFLPSHRSQEPKGTKQDGCSCVSPKIAIQCSATNKSGGHLQGRGLS